MKSGLCLLSLLFMVSSIQAESLVIENEMPDTSVTGPLTIENGNLTVNTAGKASLQENASFNDSANTSVYSAMGTNNTLAQAKVRNASEQALATQLAYSQATAQAVNELQAQRFSQDVSEMNDDSKDTTDQHTTNTVTTVNKDGKWSETKSATTVLDPETYKVETPNELPTTKTWQTTVGFRQPVEGSTLLVTLNSVESLAKDDSIVIVGIGTYTVIAIDQATKTVELKLIKASLLHSDIEIEPGTTPIDWVAVGTPVTFSNKETEKTIYSNMQKEGTGIASEGLKDATIDFTKIYNHQGSLEEAFFKQKLWSWEVCNNPEVTLSSVYDKVDQNGTVVKKGALSAVKSGSWFVRTMYGSVHMKTLSITTDYPKIDFSELMTDAEGLSNAPVSTTSDVTKIAVESSKQHKIDKILSDYYSKTDGWVSFNVKVLQTPILYSCVFGSIISPYPDSTLMFRIKVRASGGINNPSNGVEVQIVVPAKKPAKLLKLAWITNIKAMGNAIGKTFASNLYNNTATIPSISDSQFTKEVSEHTTTIQSTSNAITYKAPSTTGTAVNSNKEAAIDANGNIYGPGVYRGYYIPANMILTPDLVAQIDAKIDEGNTTGILPTSEELGLK